MNLFLTFICTISTSNLTFSPSTIWVDYDNNSEVSTCSSQTNPFVKLGGFPEPYKVIDNGDGYVYYNTETFRANYTDYSNLYLIHVETIFTPGYVAHANGETLSDGSSYKEYMLKRGYVHLGLKQYTEDDKIGGTISPKLMWPSSSSVTTTFTSSYSTALSKGISFSTGIEIGNGGSIVGTAGVSNTTSITFTYTESKSNTVSDPMLSNQYSPSDNKEAQWNFEVSDAETAGKLSYHLDTYYMFEMTNNAKNCNVDAFVLDYTVLFQSQYHFLLGIIDGWEFDNSVRIYCFI